MRTSESLRRELNDRLQTIEKERDHNPAFRDLPFVDLAVVAVILLVAAVAIGLIR